MNFRIICFFVSIFLYGCSSAVIVSVKSFRPSEVNILSRNKVVVGEFKGEGGDVVESLLRERISSSESLILVDRKYLDDVVKEQSFSNSDLTKNSKKASLGKIENAQTLLSGNVKSYSYEENLTETQRKCYDKAYFKSCARNAEEKCELQSKNYCRESDDEEECEEKYIEVCEQDIENECKDKANRDCVEYVRHGISDVDVSFNLIDIESGVNVITKVFDSNKNEETQSIDTQPQKINGKEMLRSSVNEIVDKYMKVIAPYYVEEEVVFLKDKKIPILEEGINYVKAKDWEEAEKHFFMAIEKVENMTDVSNKIAAKPHWNLSMIYKYTGEFDKALIQIKKAYDISSNSSYLEEMENIKKRKETIEKFEKQGTSDEE